MTAAIHAQLLAHGAKLPAKPSEKPQVKRNAPAPPQEPPMQTEALRSGETALSENRTAIQREYYPHPYHIQVANGTHYPGRVRIVITGPAADNLPAHLVAALTDFIKQSQL